MSDDTKKDWRDTVFLPKTDFPMKAGLPQKEPGILAAGRIATCTASCAPSVRVPKSSSSTMARPMPTAISTSATRSTIS